MGASRLGVYSESTVAWIEIMNYSWGIIHLGNPRCMFFWLWITNKTHGESWLLTFLWLLLVKKPVKFLGQWVAGCGLEVKKCSTSWLWWFSFRWQELWLAVTCNRQWWWWCVEKTRPGWPPAGRWRKACENKDPSKTHSIFLTKPSPTKYARVLS